jgi:hypothetical protein
MSFVAIKVLFVTRRPGEEAAEVDYRHRSCSAWSGIAGGWTVYLISEARFNRTYDVQVEPVAIPEDPESISYGEHIASIHGCKACRNSTLLA